MKEKYEQEKELKDTLWCNYECIEIPDSTDSWKRVQKRKHETPSIVAAKNKDWYGYCCSIFYLILLLNEPLPTAHSQIGTLLKKVKDKEKRTITE